MTLELVGVAILGLVLYIGYRIGFNKGSEEGYSDGYRIGADYGYSLKKIQTTTFSKEEN